jgi:hypothetical protein
VTLIISEGSFFMGYHTIKRKMAAEAYPEDHIADASEAHALADIFDDEESEAALNALGAKINAILLVLEAWGLTKDS